MSQKIWYLEAHDTHTNEALATELGSEMAHVGILCRDGMKRNLWECTYAVVSKFLKFKTSAHLTFTVFYREYRHGPVKLWPFAQKRKKTLSDALKRGAVTRGMRA